MGFWGFIWGATKFICGVSVFFAICYLLARFSDWVSAWELRHERKLKSFSLFCPGVMTTIKLKELLDNINVGMEGKKYTTVNRIKLKDIVSITALPSPDGNQFTIWYKDKPPKPDRNWKYGHNTNYQQQKHKGLY